MMAVAIDTEPVFDHRPPATLFPTVGLSEGQNRRFDVVPDGERFLMGKYSADAGDAADELVLFQNWNEELEQRVPVD